MTSLVEIDNIKRNTAISIINKLNSYGYKAYFAGGCVRDMLMKKIPNDYDIATNALPKEILKIYPKALRVGEHFGVIIIVIHKEHYEIATFRKDGPYLDGRRPSMIEFSDEENDVKRRDFTVNGLLYNPIDNVLYDVVEGQIDIKKQIIRTIGNAYERFDEDKLRIIRAIRFAVQLGFDIEPDTFSAIKHFANDLKKISFERIQQELFKIFLSNNPSLGLKYLLETDILESIIPEIINSNINIFNIDINLNYIIEKINSIKNSSLVTLLSFFILPLFQIDELPNNYLKRFKCSNIITNSVINILKLLYMISDFKDDNIPLWQLKRWVRDENFTLVLSIIEIFDIKNHNQINKILHIKSIYNSFINDKSDFFPKAIINGETLIKLGISPGEIFRTILFDIENKQLENKIHSEEEAIKYIEQEYKN